jgi:ribosomal protein S6
MLNQDQASDTWGRIKSFINDRNGGIDHEEKWGTRRLAYPIRKGQHQFLEGSYHLTRFSVDQPFNQELESFLRRDEQVLRSLVVIAPPPGSFPQPQVAEAVAEETPVEAVAEETPVEAVAEETPVEAVAEETPVEAVAEETPVEAEEPDNDANPEDSRG